MDELPSPRSPSPKRRRKSISVTMRPRRLSTAAISGGASGTRVSRSGMKTSCTRTIGSPNSWPPIMAVTYSVRFCWAFPVFMVCSSRRTTDVGLLLERRQCLQRGRDGAHLVAGGLQHRREHVAKERGVVDQQQRARPSAPRGLLIAEPVLEGERQEVTDVDDFGGLSLDA